MNIALKVFANNKYAAKFWFTAFISVIILAGVERCFLIRAMKKENAYVYWDEAENFHILPAKSLREITSVRQFCADLATEALFDRNPNGFDKPKLLKQLFLQCAMDDVKEYFNRTQKTFSEKKIHQKAEILERAWQKAGERSFYANYTVQLKLTGSLGTKQITHTKILHVTFHMFENPDMRNNGRLPYAVAKFELKEEVK